jgi:hypothetical protein
VPSTFGLGLTNKFPIPAPGPATQLDVNAPRHVQAGSAFSVEVDALDAENRLATGYTGTVHFSLANADTAATLPADYAFTAADHGEHVFQFTLSATGNQLITATDTTTSAINGTAALKVNPAPVAATLAVLIPEDATAGSPTKVTVEALDASGFLVAGYAGTVTLTSSDMAAVLPASYTFTSADQGFHTFQVTFNTTGSQKVTAADKNGVTGSATTTVLAAPVVDQLIVKTPDNVFAGTAANVTIAAVDGAGNRVAGYTGTVTLTSSDGAAVLPASYTFTSADQGFHTFQVTFNTTGAQKVTAIDKTGNTGSATTTVLAAPVVDHLVVKAPNNAFAGTATNVTVSAVDASGHVVPSYTGTVTLTSSDAAAVLPATYTFTSADHGVHDFQVTFNTTGADKVTATDKSALTASATTNVVAAPVVDHLVVQVPKSTPVGVPINVTVVAVDASGHMVDGYGGTIAFTSSDMAAVLPAKYTFTASDHGRHKLQIILNTAGTQTVTATDTATASITGKGSVTVNAVGAVTHFGIVGGDVALAGSPVQVKVVALDANNQVVAGYTGTVHFTSSDGSAVLPADYTFVAGDHGSHVFSVTFNTTGKETLTATDTVTSSLTGQTNVEVISLHKRHFPVDLGEDLFW